MLKSFILQALLVCRPSSNVPSKFDNLELSDECKLDDELSVDSDEGSSHIVSQLKRISEAKKQIVVDGACCVICEDGRTMSHQELLSHYYRHEKKLLNLYEDGARIYYCHMCEKPTAMEKASLHEHYRLVHPKVVEQTSVQSNVHNDSNRKRCKTCKSYFVNYEALRTHVCKKHTDRVVCYTCGRSFSHKCRLIVHIRIHTGEKPFRCSYCGKGFPEQRDVKLHERIHTGEKPYKCQYCDRSFTQRSNMVSHIRTHTGEKPYKCECCSKSFTRHSAMVRHKLIHTTEKPYKCEYCDKSFKHLDYLVTHKRVHTGEKPYKCEYCDKNFTQFSHIASHKRIHTGEKPHKCEYCDKSFTQLSHMVKHKRIHVGK